MPSQTKAPRPRRRAVFHGLAINAVTNESAKTPPSGRGAKVLQPQYSCRARAGEFGKRPHRAAKHQRFAPTAEGETPASSKLGSLLQAAAVSDSIHHPLQVVVIE